MKSCKNCGGELSRANQIYCSNSCKQKAYRDRNTLSLSDRPKFVYRPRQTNNSVVTRNFTNNLVGAYSNNMGSGLSDGIKSITNLNNHPAHSFTMLGGALLGGYVGYNMYNKGKKLSGVILGSGLGLLGGQIVYALYTQIKEYYTQKTEYEQQYTDTETISNNLIYTSQDLQYMQVNTIKTPKIFSEFLGADLNYGFTSLIYGSAGSGKSHLSTLFAKEFENSGKCLYVLAEEGITNSVQRRIEKYNLKNTDFITTRRESDVLNLAKDYKYIFIDSINGMVNYNNHLDFVRKLKSNKNLFGIFIINQVNKDGNFTGKNEVLHEVDVEISVEEGVATTRKNRFNYGNKTFKVFESNNAFNLVEFRKVSDGI
jgi:hypothetical protein